MKVNFSKAQRVTVLALVVMGVFNPMSVAVLDEYFKLIYTGVFLLASAWVCGFLLYKALKPEPQRISKKGKKDGMKFEVTK